MNSNSSMRVLVALTALFFGTALATNYSGGPHYFSWAELKVEPIKLTRPISESEAQKRERNGEAYYIGYFDKSGSVLSVEKRFERKVFFRVNYTYENGRLVKTETVASDEKKINREIK